LQRGPDTKRTTPFSGPLFFTQRLIVVSDFFGAASADVVRAKRPAQAASAAITAVSQRKPEGARNGAVISSSPNQF
jgi:hypothetical protein